MQERNSRRKREVEGDLSNVQELRDGAKEENQDHKDL